MSIYHLCESLERGIKRQKWSDEDAMERLGCNPAELEAIRNATINAARLLDMIGDAGLEVRVNFPKRSKSKEVSKTNDEAMFLLDRLCDWLQKNSPRGVEVDPPVAWYHEARKLLELDKVSLDYAVQILDWCQQDDFWKMNILSMPKFRKQFNQLEIKAFNQPKLKARGENPAAPYLAGGFKFPSDSAWFMHNNEETMHKDHILLHTNESPSELADEGIIEGEIVEPLELE